MLNPLHLRELGVELIQRTRDNAYGSHGEYQHRSQEERAKLYDELKAKIEQEGFRRDLPITVMLRRQCGNKDKILQGHHRLSVAIEIDLKFVPVRFVY
jgi:hypothetical protein